MTDEEKKAELQAKIEQNAVEAESIKDNGNELQGEMERLEKKIAEEKKPKLRTCDYGFDLDGNGFIKLRDAFFYTAHGGRSCLSEREGFGVKTILGNLGDDLKAMQEDVEEGEWSNFVIDTAGYCVSLRTQLKENAVWLYSTDGKGVKLEAKKLSALILDLQCKLATVKRKAAK